MVSDHGAQAMYGGIQINEWLMQNGYLTLADPPTGPTPIGRCTIDWPHTTAWGRRRLLRSRIFLNVKGREPPGTIAPRDYEPLRDELIAKLEALGDDQRRPIGTRVYRPEDLYRAVRGAPPT